MVLFADRRRRFDVYEVWDIKNPKVKQLIECAVYGGCKNEVA